MNRVKAIDKVEYVDETYFLFYFTSLIYICQVTYKRNFNTIYEQINSLYLLRNCQKYFFRFDILALFIDDISDDTLDKSLT